MPAQNRGNDPGEVRYLCIWRQTNRKKHRKEGASPSESASTDTKYKRDHPQQLQATAADREKSVRSASWPLGSRRGGTAREERLEGRRLQAAR